MIVFFWESTVATTVTNISVFIDMYVCIFFFFFFFFVHSFIIFGVLVISLFGYRAYEFKQYYDSTTKIRT